MEERACVNCAQSFTIRDQDLTFYEDMGVPPPTHCYLCRMQRRLANRSERFLYHRKCDLSGKQVISTYSPDKPYKLYDLEEWWSDKWDAKTYGRDYDFSRPFFAQFQELREVVPRIARIQQLPMENSDWCNCVSRLKSCYLIFSSNENEDCYYGSWVNQCKDCVDVLNVENCELCYQCTSCRDCYALRYSQDCQNCRSSFFLRDCQGCQNCFGCSNQINKQHMVFNQQKTESEYKHFLEQVQTGSYSEMLQAQSSMADILKDHVVKEYHGMNVENCVGDYLRDCKNAYACFECDHSEDITYCQCLQNSKRCMDHSYWGQGAENVYECQACGYEPNFMRFCNLCWTGCSDLTYCDHCLTSRNSFGCIGLRRDEYCILNKQYSREEYEALVPRIIEHMQSTNEWGEFFPITMAIYAYNETLAYEQLPMTKEEVLAKGWKWLDEEEQQKSSYMGPKKTIPDTISEVSDDICNNILICETTGKPYKIIPQELKFYKEHGVPIPRVCPDERHWRRLKLRNPRILHDRQCAKCSKDIQTTYSPDRPETVYCESCYLEAVY